MDNFKGHGYIVSTAYKHINHIKEKNLSTLLLLAPFGHQ
jgi:hypothetical protein